jgi:hypothetical protein
MEAPNEFLKKLQELPEALPIVEPVLDAIPVKDLSGAQGPAPMTTLDGLPFAFWSAQLSVGLTTQYGFVILRPRYVAFVPTTGRSNLVGDLASNAIGLTTIDFDLLFKYRSYTSLRKILERMGIERFDACVREEVGRAGGLCWHLQDVSLSRQPNPILSRWDLLVFSNGETSIRGMPPKKDQDFVQTILRNQMGDARLPTSLPYLAWMLLAAMPTAAAIGIYTSVDHSGGHGVEGVVCAAFVGALAAVAWALAIRMWYRAFRDR